MLRQRRAGADLLSPMPTETEERSATQWFTHGGKVGWPLQSRGMAPRARSHD